MTYAKAIEWLKQRKYDDDMVLGNKRRIKHNEDIDAIIRLLMPYIKKPEREVDPDCASGVCPIRK
jgi:hypothetical protein